MEIPDDVVTALLPAVEQQLASKDTLFVGAACERLVSKHGCSDDEARELIAQALAIASNRMMISGKPFDVPYYRELLANLPALPDESA